MARLPCPAGTTQQHGAGYGGLRHGTYNKLSPTIHTKIGVNPRRLISPMRWTNGAGKM